MKSRAALLLLLTFAHLFYAEEKQEAIQLIFPKKVFVGTSVEIQYAFSSGVNFFPEQDGLTAEKPLIAEYLPFEAENDDFSLQKAVIRKDGVRYSAVFTLIPWRTGIIDIPPFNLYAAAFGSSKADFTIDLEPFEVTSVLDEYGASSMQKP